MRPLLAVLAFVFLTAAAPKDSSYSGVAQKKEALGSTQELQPVREESVKPSEVFKHGVQEVGIIATDTGYLPAKIFVRRNIPVKLYVTSASARKLCFMMDDFSLRKGISNQSVEQLSFLPTKPGQYRFYCPVQEIEGQIIVRD
ncbi:MAG: cupredoxin domain-containing protein [Bdellovibrionota bacterium]